MLRSSRYLKGGTLRTLHFAKTSEMSRNQPANGLGPYVVFERKIYVYIPVSYSVYFLFS
jgi:hypothetical protein